MAYPRQRQKVDIAQTIALAGMVVSAFAVLNAIAHGIHFVTLDDLQVPQSLAIPIAIFLCHFFELCTFFLDIKNKKNIIFFITICSWGVL